MSYFWERTLQRAKAQLAKERKKLDSLAGCGNCGHPKEKHRKVKSGKLACSVPKCGCLHPAVWPVRYGDRTGFARYPFITKKAGR